jgi:putative SOS response-associated peptidase YedK
MCFSVEVKKDIDSLLKPFKANISLYQKDYELLRAKSDDLNFVKDALSLKRKPSSNFFKEPGADNRIFPGYFTWVLVQENGQNVFKKMRYRLRPANSKEEIPTKFNVFNARLDSLETRQTWSPLFSKKHGLIPFTRFFEWVEHNEEKKLISFSPKDREIMWAPCLFDYWENEKKDFGFYSFALITHDPPDEVSSMGHDRCPIFLKKEVISEWLSPSGKTQKELSALLSLKESVFYLNEWAA